MWNLDSSAELSCHARPISVRDVADAFRFEGGLGGAQASVVALLVLLELEYRSSLPLMVREGTE